MVWSGNSQLVVGNGYGEAGGNTGETGGITLGTSDHQKNKYHKKNTGD